MTRFPFFVPEKLSLEGLQSEVTGLLDRWWHCGLNTGPLDGQDWAPPVELRDEPDGYRVFVELPGVDRSQIELIARQGSLAISGQKCQPMTPSQSDQADAPTSRVVQTQRRYGRFRRMIHLPGPVQIEAISATLANGVLDVTLPKAAGTESAEVVIEVKTPDSPAT